VPETSSAPLAASPRFLRVVPRARPRAIVVLAGVVVALELWAALAHVGHIARAGYRAFTAPSVPVQAADLDPLSVYVLTEALVRARSVIPPHATFAIVTDPGLTATQQGEVSIPFKLVLLPRVFVADPHSAQWVIAYRVSSESLGIPYSKEIGLAPDVNVIEATHPEGAG
jgi:hypothetical protein